MTARIIHISFMNTLEELCEAPARKQTDRAILAALATDKRFSVFAATSSMKVARSLERLAKRGLYRTIRKGYGFPWLGAQITKAGREFLRGAR